MKTVKWLLSRPIFGFTVLQDCTFAKGIQAAELLMKRKLNTTIPAMKTVLWAIDAS